MEERFVPRVIRNMNNGRCFINKVSRVQKVLYIGDEVRIH
jgi:hypothetical protein